VGAAGAVCVLERPPPGHAQLFVGDAQHVLPDVARRTVQRDLKRPVELGLVTEIGRGATDPNRAYRWGARSCDKL
jgi:hypothetical protein